MNFLAAPVLGVLSDRFGRRPVILISVFGFALDLVVMAMAPSVGWLVVGRMLSGVTAASTATAAAYIVDITPPEQRAGRFGLFAATYGAGMILGPAVGGLLGEFSPRAPFWVAAGLAAVGWLYGLLVLPESLPPEKRGPLSWRAAIPIRSFAILLRDRTLMGLGCVTLLMQLSAQTGNNIFVLYTAHRYGWSVGQVGLMLMVFSAGNMLMQGLVTPRIAGWIGDWRTMFAGLTLSGLGLVAGGLSSTGALFCVASAALSGISAIAGMSGPVIFTQVYAWSVSTPNAAGGPGLALMLGGLLMFMAMVFGLMAARSA
jgi:DHA1 family tetracycline resistance protein-like MFS transporter